MSERRGPSDAGRVALVTGGTRGLGQGIVERLLDDGWCVLATSRTGKWDGPHPDGLLVRRADVCDTEACEHAVGDAIRAWGHLDHLVNNAGVVRDVAFRSMTLQDWDEVIRTSLTGAFVMTKAALDAVTSSDNGRIVNVSSVAATMGSTWQANYAAAKSGLTGLTRTLAREVARSGTTVNQILLGPTAEGIGEQTPSNYVEAVARKIPLARLGTGEDLAHAVRFLLDDASAYVTGTTLTVDGGLSMG